MPTTTETTTELDFTTQPDETPETTDKTTTVTTTTLVTTTTKWTPKMGGDFFVVNSNVLNQYIQFSWKLSASDPEFIELEDFKWPRDTRVEQSCSLTFRGKMYILGGTGT